MYRGLSYCSSPILRLLFCIQSGSKPVKASTRLVDFYSAREEIGHVFKMKLASFLLTSVFTFRDAAEVRVKTVLFQKQIWKYIWNVTQNILGRDKVSDSDTEDRCLYRCHINFFLPWLRHGKTSQLYLYCIFKQKHLKILYISKEKYFIDI